MKYGLFNKLDTPRHACELSTEALAYGLSVEDSLAACSRIENRYNDLVLAIETEAKLRYELLVLDNSIGDNTISTESYIGGISSIVDSAIMLTGTESAFTHEFTSLLDIAAEDATLSIEEFKKKRRGIIENLLTGVIDKMSTLFNKDEYKNILTDIKSIYTADEVRVLKVKVLRTELKSGKVSLGAEAVVNDLINKHLGGYSLMSSKFTAKTFIAYLKGYYELINNGLITDSISDVTDSLVQSMSNEVRVPTHKKSIAYIESFKNMDKSKYLYKDTRIVIPSDMLGPHIIINQVIQGEGKKTSDGMAFYNDLVPGDTDVYRKLEVRFTTKEMIELIDITMKNYDMYKKYMQKETVHRAIIENLKLLRSQLMTGIYQVLGGVFAIKRIIRQFMLAGPFVNNMNGVAVSTFRDFSKSLIVILLLADNLKKK